MFLAKSFIVVDPIELASGNNVVIADVRAALELAGVDLSKPSK